ncbi:hypothetical protein C0995_008235 [Termitomyces sp. Mi166|nr:hypothetical protein C0995_008235 [Termitomyces sp. Mi166\
MPGLLAAEPDAMPFPPSGDTTPKKRPSSSGSRRETILNLVEMLLQNHESDRGNFEDDRDVPTVDEHLQVVGAEAFHRFKRRIEGLDKELRNFANAARQLGSSVAILSSAFDLRERLAQLLFLYHENAADLFNRKIAHIAKEIPPERPKTEGRDRRRKRVTTANLTGPHIVRLAVNENLDLEEFPAQLKLLAKAIRTFSNCLNEFPEFTDEAVNTSMSEFEGDLEYWASCLKEYAGQFRHQSVQRYVHDLSSEMGEHIDTITSTLSMFIEVGVPTIRFAQKHGATNLLNLSTVATFFSAVTATTMQFSFNLSRNNMSDAVNCFWFASLVFSIAAAVNSLLGLTWKQAMYRSPGDRVPWWVLIWIKRSPLVFLVVSVACFSIGLCLFAYASGQAPVTSTLTTIFTAITSFGLAAVSAWFASERWIYLRHQGRKWLSDALTEYTILLMRLPGMGQAKAFLEFTSDLLLQWVDNLQQFCAKLLCIAYARSSSSEQSDDVEAAVLPTAYANNVAPETPTLLLRSRSDVMTEPPNSPPFSPTPTINEKSAVDPPSLAPISPGRQLWTNALRSVRMHSAISSPPPEPRRRRTSSSNIIERKKTMMSEVEPGKAVMRSRVAALSPKLKQLEPTQDVAAHSGLVRHLQFSPDGRYLATSSWDKTSVVFRVEDPLLSHRILAHPAGCPTGNLLLTKFSRGVKVWTSEVGICVGSNSQSNADLSTRHLLFSQEGVCRKTIDRKTNVESIAWFPDGRTFISVEGSDVTKLVCVLFSWFIVLADKEFQDLTGKVLDQYDFGRMKLHDVAITPDSLRLIGVGPLLESPDGLQPSKSRAEKRLVVYNMETNLIENQTPVLNDVRDITVATSAQGGIIALISYENKAPPQLWKLELLKDKENPNLTKGRLTLRHTYMPKVQVDFAGPSYFGGKNNEMVFCAAGDIHIWDQESAALLHHIRGQSHGGDLTCIAWNHAAEDPFMFATGSHDGAVRIWTTRPDDDLGEENSVVRTDSPVEFLEEEKLHTGSSQQSSEDGSRGTASGPSRRRHTLAAPVRSKHTDPYQEAIGLTFRQRILAYAAAQREADAKAQAQTQSQDLNQPHQLA